MACESVLGRAGECQIRASDDAVSRIHARLTPVPDGLKVSDQGSRHGTFVDGQPVTSSPVSAAPGSVLRCGQTLFLVVRDPENYDIGPRRLSREFTGMAHDVFAGPTTWRAWQQATQAASVEHPVLVLGESGTGKEVIARLLHASSPRKGKFVPVNSAAIPDTLFESELFGHQRGAFTGATAARLGAFREARGGTLFLDEIGELRPELQVKLLRAVEAGQIRPLGAQGDEGFDARLVAATSRDLEAAVQAGGFRQDLYFRLSGVVIRVPPLRERRDEILMLAAQRLAADAAGCSLSATAAEALVLRHWPGNIRELQHALVRATLEVAAEGGTVILPHHLPASCETARPSKIELTADAVRVALRQAGGKAADAARLLGVSRATLYNFCSRQRIDLATLRAEAREPDGG